MSNLKVGQILHVKKDFDLQEADDPAKIIHKIGDVVKILAIKSTSSGYLYPVKVLFNKREEPYTFDEIKEYFYDLAEWREKQINSILDD